MSGERRAVPSSLSNPDLDPLWASARARLDRYGTKRRGRLTLPDGLSDIARHAVRSLLNRDRLPRQVDLSEMESALTRLDLGPDLDASLSLLGFAPSPHAADRRAQRESTRSTRLALEAAVAVWPEPWAATWLDEVVAGGVLAGLSPAEAVAVVADVRRLLDTIEVTRQPRPPLITNDDGLAARSDLAAAVLGSAHALDNDQVRQRAMVRALSHRQSHAVHPDPLPSRRGSDSPDPLPGRTGQRDHPEARNTTETAKVWERAGFHLDSVSAPVLTWGLDLNPDSALADLATQATAAGIPLHLSNFALTRHSPVSAKPGAMILLAENPRVVEAAAELRVPWTVIATGGNPTSAPLTLVGQFLNSGAVVRYHGDFDPAGLGICRRVASLGCEPWLMSARDYDLACEEAIASGVELPRAPGPCGPTPWDNTLQTRFDTVGVVVHEEFVLHRLLDPNRW